MEKAKEKPTDKKPLLLSLAIPISLSLACFLISLTTINRTRSTQLPSNPEEDPLMDSPRCVSRHEFDDSDEDREEEREREASSCPQRFESAREISLAQFHDGSNLDEAIGGMKGSVIALQERECELEAQFDNYCSVKEQESAFQKLQIMYLGLKLESVESHNRRLEGRTRADIGLLRSRVKKLSRVNRVHSRVIRQHAQNLQAREAEILRGGEELRPTTEEIRGLASRLHERRAVEETVELRTPMDLSTSKSKEGSMAPEDGEMLRSSNKFFDQLEELRDRWSADMEELIYLGWINVCLRRELLIDQDDDDEKEEAEVAREMGGLLVLEEPVNEQARHLSMEFYDSKHQVGRKKARFLHKLKGWARGKGRCKRGCNGD